MAERAQNWQAILDKLQQIEALKERGATQAEQEAAAAMLTKMLNKHNLSMEAYRSRVGTVDRSATDGYVKEDFLFPARGSWRGDLLNVICRHVGCRPLFYSDGRRTVIIGTPETVEFAKRMFTYTSADMLKLADTAWTMHKVFGSQANGKTFKASFLTGCVWGLDTAMRQAKHEAEAETEGGSALAVIAEQRLDDAMNAFFPKMGKGKSKNRNIDGNAYRAGFASGQGLTVGERL